MITRREARDAAYRASRARSLAADARLAASLDRAERAMVTDRPTYTEQYIAERNARLATILRKEPAS